MAQQSQDHLIKHLEKLRQESSLDFLQQYFDDCLSLVRNDKTLQRLEFHNFLTDELFFYLGQSLLFNTHLKILDVSCNQLSAASCRLLARAPYLECLDIHSNPLQDDGVQALANTKRLESLNVASTEITGFGMLALAANTSFKQLTLCSNMMGDEEMEAFAANTSLTMLDVSSNHITSIGAEILAKNRNIFRLIISYNPIFDEGFEALLSNPCLKYIQVLGCNISELSIQRATHLSTLKHVNCFWGMQRFDVSSFIEPDIIETESAQPLIDRHFRRENNMINRQMERNRHRCIVFLLAFLSHSRIGQQLPPDVVLNLIGSFLLPQTMIKCLGQIESANKMKNKL
jgi:hypothetical protein